MSSPGKKKKPVIPPTEQTTPKPSLPDDLLLSCFARISRLHYPALSLASKSFRSLLSSPELYKARSSLGRGEETCLYVCLRYGPYSNPNTRWFTLCQKPDQTLTNHTNKKKEKPSRYTLAPVPISNPPQANLKGMVAIGSSIYAIGGTNEDSPSSNVSILDCQSHTWREAPSMRVKRYHPGAHVLDGKIYVIGGCCNSSEYWIEVFDQKTQVWEFVSKSPLGKRRISYLDNSAVIEGNIYMFGNEREREVYKAKEDRWEEIGENYSRLQQLPRASCVIDNLVYISIVSGRLLWYDSKINHCWRDLNGLEGLDIATCLHAKLVDYGGKMAVFWDKDVVSNENIKVICCAVIALERGNYGKILGNVEWCEDVLTVPKSYKIFNALSVTF